MSSRNTEILCLRRDLETCADELDAAMKLVTKLEIELHEQEEKHKRDTRKTQDRLMSIRCPGCHRMHQISRSMLFAQWQCMKCGSWSTWNRSVIE